MVAPPRRETGAVVAFAGATAHLFEMRPPGAGRPKLPV